MLSVHVKNKETVIALHDLTYFNARCDAIYFTTEKDRTLPSGKDELASFLKNCQILLRRILRNRIF